MAGRPKGVKDSKPRLSASRALADAALQTGITPLQVMLQAMRKHVDDNRWDEAAAIAKDAAPYVHAKLAAIQHSGPDGKPIALQVEYSWRETLTPLQPPE